MSFKLEQGLFGLDFTDHHAVLGVSVNADVKEIRQRYLKIARRLHPDSSDLKSDGDRQRANELLSKLVNPSYEFLSQDRNLTEHLVLLKLKGEQAQKQQDTVVLSSDAARQLASASNPDQVYLSQMTELAKHQYDALETTLSVIAQISELNLVYLIRRISAGSPVGQPIAAPDATSAPAASPSAAAAKKSAPPSRDELVGSFIRRSEEFEKKRDYAQAILELREGLKIQPTNAVCHSRLGMIYLKTKQPKMARIHFNKALELDPKNEVAQTGLRSLSASDPASTAQSSSTTAAKSKPGKSEPKPGGGLFGLFGGNKKK
jgi:curved DNA-binding protein CbpA